MKSLKKSIVIVNCLSGLMLFNISCNKSKHVKISAYDYEYTRGELNKDGYLAHEEILDEKGNIIEERDFRKDKSLISKTVYRYNSNGKLEEQAEYDSISIINKKIITYNSFGLRESLKIFWRVDNLNKNFVQVAGMIYVYDNAKRLVKKKWYGAITFLGEETGSVTKDSETGEIAKQDTMIGIITYRKGNLKDSVLVYTLIGEHNEEKLKGQKPEYGYLYKYNNQDSLISREKFMYSGFTLSPELKSFAKNLVKDTVIVDKEAEFVYENNLLKETIKYTGKNWLTGEYRKKVEQFDAKGNCISRAILEGSKVSTKILFTYDESGETLEAQIFDEANEPVSKRIFKYE